ncbi:hypothetical protein BDZ90DRAFT_152029 [Jaminaea rosea]|uniref:Uncharacterized protein n=1 Tax=Jaminaea rosea TaxID=1569628 RepID=A0A316UTF5_9BASI|nr:hypothetical protein BDZ90DRAFT_152029 [Jaminaea rosea]PWN28570.1 hypothetical protein BDZ90DRAFT_152029 [Jaminaea rosea]
MLIAFLSRLLSRGSTFPQKTSSRDHAPAKTNSTPDGTVRSSNQITGPPPRVSPPPPPSPSSARQQLIRAFKHVRNSVILSGATRKEAIVTHRQADSGRPYEATVDEIFRHPLSSCGHGTGVAHKPIASISAPNTPPRSARINLNASMRRRPSNLSLGDVKDKLRSFARRPGSHSIRDSALDVNGTYGALHVLEEANATAEAQRAPRPLSPNADGPPTSPVHSTEELIDSVDTATSAQSPSERVEGGLHPSSSQTSLYESIGNRPLSLKSEGLQRFEIDYTYIGGAGVLLDHVSVNISKENTISQHEGPGIRSHHASPQVEETWTATSPSSPQADIRRPSGDICRWPEIPSPSFSFSQAQSTAPHSPHTPRRFTTSGFPFPTEMERISLPPAGGSQTTVSLSSYQCGPSCWTPSPPPPPLPPLPPFLPFPSTSASVASASASASAASSPYPSPIDAKPQRAKPPRPTTLPPPTLLLMSDVWTRERLAHQERAATARQSGSSIGRVRTTSRSPSPSPTLASWTRRYHGGSSSSPNAAGGSSGSGGSGPSGGSLLSSRTMRKYMSREAGSPGQLTTRGLAGFGWAANEASPTSPGSSSTSSTTTLMWRRGPSPRREASDGPPRPPRRSQSGDFMGPKKKERGSWNTYGELGKGKAPTRGTAVGTSADTSRSSSGATLTASPRRRRRATDGEVAGAVDALASDDARTNQFNPSGKGVATPSSPSSSQTIISPPSSPQVRNSSTSSLAPLIPPSTRTPGSMTIPATLMPSPSSLFSTPLSLGEVVSPLALPPPSDSSNIGENSTSFGPLSANTPAAAIAALKNKMGHVEQQRRRSRLPPDDATGGVDDGRVAVIREAADFYC